MTEDMIELRAERMMDLLDKEYAQGDITAEEYLIAVRDINEWVKERYTNLLEDLRNN